jgi:hypothetical protein
VVEGLRVWGGGERDCGIESVFAVTLALCGVMHVEQLRSVWNGGIGRKHTPPPPHFSLPVMYYNQITFQSVNTNMLIHRLTQARIHSHTNIYYQAWLQLHVNPKMRLNQD